LRQHLQPMVPVRLAADGKKIAVSFGERGRASRHTDRPNLARTRVECAGWTLRGPRGPRYGRSSSRARGRALYRVLDPGERGRRPANNGTDVDRQRLEAWSPGGHLASGRRCSGRPAPSAPRAATADGRHVLVTLAATSGESFELRAVSLEDAARPDSSDQTAQR